jgi:hypothetical protein
MLNGIELPAFNFDGTVSPYAITGNTENPGEPSVTELAKSFQPHTAVTPLSEIFPVEEIMERNVFIEQEMSTTDTIFPLVRFGQPDVVLGHNYGTRRGMMVQPLYVRRSGFVSYGEINTKIRPGSVNEKWSPEEQISMIVQGMVREHNLTWDVWRASMLLGGINYTDPRSGIGASVNAQIPARNFFHYGVTSGYRGRNEAKLFRSLSDFNDPGPVTGGIPWTHPDADIVSSVSRLVRWFKETNKGVITAMYMHPELKEILMMNNQVRLVTGGLFVATSTTNNESIQIGRTQFCVSEESGGRPGLWTRTQTETQIPAAPGMYIQMGNAGMPYLKYPYMVAHMTVGEVEEINNRIGLLGDLHWGQF